MSLTDLFRHRRVCDKDVYVVDDHHQALAPWVLIRRRLDRAPNLITIDHHTDVHEAFLGHAHLETYESGGDAWALAKELVKRIDWQDDQSLCIVRCSYSIMSSRRYRITLPNFRNAGPVPC